MLADDGVQIVIVTREDSQIAAARAKKLQFPFRIGVKDKRQAIDALAVEYSTPHHQIAVIGDDVYDLPAMAVAGVSVCPQDAVPAVKAVAQYCMMSAGGHGAVREFCEMVMVEREGKRSRVKK
jgi:YrbI family 3-deoxy-D-manno-octulosonate 8-phosphate phosphatase